MNNNKTHIFITILALSLIIYFSFRNKTKNEIDNGEKNEFCETFENNSFNRYLDINIDSLTRETFILKKGDNLGGILRKFNIDPQIIERVRVKSEDVFDISKFRVGNSYSILSDLNEGFAQYMVYEKNKTEHIIFDLRDTINVYNFEKEITVKPSFASAEITSSLWNAINKKGYDLDLSDRLAEIYAWQIDFFGIAKGDNFKVLYNESYIDDSIKVGINNVKGAIFRHHDKDYYAIPFVQDSILEYFDENGDNLRKAFLKAPLKFSRISSTFSNARRHPVLKIVRPHHGVDYAAPVGTPVRTIGDGIVTKRGYQAGGAGNYVKIKHNSSYETTYMHLSKFGTGIKEGTRVSQGQIIGYVGSTGSSTGPHLDFRVHFQGKPINPLKMESPKAEPISEHLRDSFNIVKQQIINELNNSVL